MTPPLAAGDLLAVYGLLRPGSIGLDSLRLRARVRVVGPCRIPGRLIDLGSYPGLIAGSGEVVGDLVSPLDDGVGAAFDDFEGFDPAKPDAGAYRREKVRLVEPDREAWVYAWIWLTGSAPLVPSGDWLVR
jgi:gamma-glutamylcyclotransferase (GGCT)/AIG2-like uncharacterized protein YtfP